MRTLQFLLFVVVALVGNYAHAKVDVIPGRGHTIYNVNIDKVTFSDATAGGKKFQQAKLVGVDGYEGILFVEGNPELPVVRLLVEGESTQVSVGGAQKVLLPKRGVPLKPALASAPKIKGAKAIFKFNAKAYKANAFMPAREFDVQNAGSVRGKQRLMVTLYPIAYNPATGEVQYRNNFQVTVKNKVEAKRKDAQPMIAFVVGQKFANSPHVARYAEHKRANGFRVETIVVGTDATTDAEIRAKLQALLAMSSAKLQYALLIGDAEDVPGHQSSHISGTTDLYYAAIDTADYESDLHAPDIAVGRFSVATEQQLSDVVDKSIAYQRGLFNQEQWLNAASFLATDDRYQVAEGSHNYVIETYTAPKGYVGIFPQANQAGGDQLYAITHQVPNNIVQQAIGEGRTMVVYSGHGAETFWDAPRVDQANVRAFSSDSALPFVASHACITGNFHVSESFAETWNRHRYGAIVFWGSMDSTYWDEDDILEKRMFDGVYVHNKASFGDITTYALTEHWLHYGGAGRATYYWETYHVFGDPSLQLRTTKTSAAVVEGPSEVPVGVYPIEYTIRDEAGRALANTMVSLKLKDGATLAVAKTDSNGLVSFSPSEDAVGPGTELALIVNGQNLRETSFATTVISPDSAWLNVRDVRVNGRADLLVGANETVQLAMNVANVGLVATQGATLAIESVTGPARVVSGNSGVAALQPGSAQGLDGTQFVVHVSPNAQRGDVIRVNFTWTTVEGTMGRAVKTIQVARATLNVSSVDFGLGVQDGGIRPGETGQVFVTVINSGNETMRNAILNVTADTCLAAASGSISIAELAPGQSMRAPVAANVTIDNACHSGDAAKFRLDGTYEGLGGMTSVSANGQFTAGVVAIREIESANVNLSIPDAGSPVEHEIRVEGAGMVSELAVHVRITHTYIGDLMITLVHPDGTEVALYNQDGGSSANLDAVFGMGGTAVAGLSQLAGKPMQGTWKIRVQDTASADVGTLDYVKLTVKGFMD